MTIQLNRNNKTLTVAVKGRLDTLTSPELEEQLEPALEDTEKMVFDLAELEYISSAGLRVLHAAVTVAGIEMIETIKASGVENGFFQKWSGYQASVNAQNVKSNKMNNYLGMIPAFLSTLANYAVMVMGIWFVMKRKIEFDENWWKDAHGAILAYKKDGDEPTALLPDKFSGYYFIDRANSKRIKLTKKTAELFEREAYCFYKPLPQRKLTIPDLLRYMKGCMTMSDSVMIVFAALVVTGVGMLMPRITKALTGPVISSGSTKMLVGIAVCMLCTAISSQLISSVNAMLNSRIQTKTSLGVQSAMMMRIMSLPANFFRNYSAGELMSRSMSVNQLCELILGIVVGTGLSSLTSLLYITQIFSFAPVLVVPSLLIILTTVIFTTVSSVVQIRLSKRQMELGARESGVTYAMISGVQKIKLSGAEKRFFARWLNLYSDSVELTYAPPTFIKINGVITTTVSLWAVFMATISHGRITGYGMPKGSVRRVECMTSIRDINVKLVGNALCFLMKEVVLIAMIKTETRSE